MKKSIGSGRGSVYNILLKALQSGDKYGYEICKEIEEKTNGSYILKQASLYSGLKRLEAQGDITSYWRDSALGGRRHYYSLTKKGLDRINGSNFAWTDARNDIVDSLFEKSEIEKEIENITTQIEDIKTRTTTSENVSAIINSSNDIQYTESTEKTVNSKDNSINKNEQNSSNSSDDLFSMFTNYNFNENHDENLKNLENSNSEKTEENTIENNFDKVDETIENQEQSTLLNNDNIIKVKDVFDESKDFQKNNIVENKENFNAEENKNIENLKENTQINLFSFNFEEENNQNKSNIEDAQIEEKSSTFDDIMSNLQTIENQNNDNYQKEDEKTEQNLNIYKKVNTDEDKNLEKPIDIQQYSQINKPNVQQSNETINKFENKIQEETRIEKLQKNNENVLSDYLKSHLTINKFSDSLQYELPDNDYSNYFENVNETKKEDLKIDQNNPSFENNQNNIENHQNISNVLNVNSQQNSVENIDNKIENKIDKSNNFDDNIQIKFNENNLKNEDENMSNKVESIFINQNQDNINSQVVSNQNNIKNEIESNQIIEKNNASFNYKDIFGDLISNQKEISLSQTENSNNLNSIESKTNESQEKELPRINQISDINRTLNYNQENYKFDDIYNNSYEENPFEKYDKINQKNDIFEESNLSQTETRPVQGNTKISFDKKFANENNYFDLPEYEIRYYKKNISQSKNSKFISINKLNLMTSAISCFLIFLLTTLTIVFTNLQKIEINATQKTIFVLSYAIGVLMLIFNFIKYLRNKNKKISGLNHNEKVNNTVVAIIVLVLSITINFMFGFNLTNIFEMAAGIFVPIIYFFVILLKFSIKKFLIKFSTFYN